VRLRAAAAIRLLLHQGLRVDELARADVTDLGHDRGHQILTVTRKGGPRVALVLPPATTAALDAYLTTRTPLLTHGHHL
jgi:integrase/recombinase XerD